MVLDSLNGYVTFKFVTHRFVVKINAKDYISLAVKYEKVYP